MTTTMMDPYECCLYFVCGHIYPKLRIIKCYVKLRRPARAVVALDLFWTESVSTTFNCHCCAIFIYPTTEE